MGEVSLLQYYHGVLYVPIPEVYLHVHLCFRLATTPLNWAGPRPCLWQKCHNVRPGLVTTAFSVALLYWTTLHHAVLVLEV